MMGNKTVSKLMLAVHVIPPVKIDNASKPNKIISPYFKEGLFAGVRVTFENEDFVIAPEDYHNGKLMHWVKAMSALNGDNLITWNRHQLGIVIHFLYKINKILVNYDKVILSECYWTCEESPVDRDFAYYGDCYNELGYISEIDRWFSCYVRPIKNLKNQS